jgi:hypothetical protein
MSKLRDEIGTEIELDALLDAVANAEEDFRGQKNHPYRVLYRLAKFLDLDVSKLADPEKPQ